MSRLLFAAARGARIEYLGNTLYAPFEWRPAARIDTIGQPPEPQGIRPKKTEWRIHPDDEHLQYGPISTALREFVISGGDRLPGISAAYAYADRVFGNWFFELVGEELDVTLLILAEELADEGL